MKVKIMLSVAIMAFVVMSCKSDDVPASLNIPIKEVFFSIEAGEKIIIINCNKEYTISSPSSWCKVSKVKSGVMTTVTANETGQERTAIITITCDNLSEQISITQSGDEFCTMRIATYNILYQGTTWSASRKELVINLIRKYDFEIFGVQEARLSTHLTDLTADGTYAYTGKAQGSVGHICINAIIYKKSRFELLDAGDFWYSLTPDVSSFGWDDQESRHTCSWGKFNDKVSGREFYVFNSHLSTVNGNTRNESAKLLLSRIKSIAGDSPVFATGDFNSWPGGLAIQTILNDGLLGDAYALTEKQPTGTEGTYNGLSDPVNRDRIDYIFVTKNIRVKEYGVINDRPGGQFPSDHDPVLVVAEF